MIWCGRWERGSGLGTHVHPWRIHVDVWQSQCSTVKQNKVKKKKKSTHLEGINKAVASGLATFVPLVIPVHFMEDF